MVIPCPICGKLTAIYWPQFWVYRRGETYYCSENCLVVDRTRDIRLMNQVARERRIRKGVESMGKHRLTLEQKKKAVEIAGQGGDHLAYLKKCGAKNPSAAWVYIKKTLMNKATKDIMEIPPIKAQEPAEEKAEKPILAEVAEKVPEVEGLKPKQPEAGSGIRIMTAQEHQAAHRSKERELMEEAGLLYPEATTPLFEGFYISKDIKVTAIETDHAKFSVTESGSIRADVKTGASVTMILLKKEEWMQLMDGLKTAMKIFAGGK